MDQSPEIPTPVSPPIQTKLHRPRPTDDLVVRGRLYARLDRAVAGKLTLVSAPAGFGKTTLVSGWLESHPAPAAWLALDAGDRDLTTFLLYLTLAIQSAEPSACRQTAQLLHTAPTPRFDRLFATLINELAALPFPLIVALDDYDRVRDEGVNRFMARLTDAQPAQLHLVIISRTDPLLPLPRLRVDRQITEIRARDLRFSAHEAEAFLCQTVQNTDGETAAQLNERVEGWPAGLRLAALSMDGADDYAHIVHGFQGDVNRFVTEYLAAEVLAQQSPEIQDFLLATAILDQFCPELCDAVTAQPAGTSRKTLDELLRANLFLVELDDEQGWYRYHHLFQAMLQQMLVSRTQPADVVECHHRAGTWFIAHDFVEMALRHALAANDMARAADMLEEKCLNPLNRVERHRLERWLALLDDDVIWQRPQLLIAQAWQLYRQFRLAALDDLLDHAEAALAQNYYNLEGDAAQTFRGNLQAFRSGGAYLLRGDDQRAAEAAEQALRWLPVADCGGQGIALAYGALAQQALGEQQAAAARLAQAIEDPSHLGPAKPQALLGLAFLQFFAGDLAQMAQTTRRFCALAAASQQANVIGGAHYTSGFLAYELNDLVAAQTHFAAVADVRDSTNLAAATSCLLGLARIHQLYGELDSAQQIIHDLRAKLTRYQSADLLPQVDAFQARQWALQGDVTAALRWARRIDEPRFADYGILFVSPVLARVQILIDHGNDDDFDGLTSRLQAAAAQAEARHNRLSLVRTLAQLALLTARLEREDEALATLTRTVELAQPGGFVRAFVDCGPDMRHLLEKLSRRAVAPSYLTQLRNAFATAPATNGAQPAPPFTSSTEPLTRREQEVLDLLQQGLTNQEIADQLVISLHTAKRHVSNIYIKLDVHSRKQVLHRARQLRLI